MNKSNHIPVLLKEAIDNLNINPDGIYIDCTLGGGGHASEILKRLSSNGRLICFDQDDYAIDQAKMRLEKISSNYLIIKSNFVNIKKELNAIGINKVDGILYDLGVSSYQLDMADRGFSYHIDADLDMRMDKSQYLKAYDIVNFYSYDELRKIFFSYGEEKYSNYIAKKIINSREEKLISSTLELSNIVISALPPFVRRSEKHPAKKIFQALRIAVNDELNVFEQSLREALTILNKKGRIAVITFHSLEDRICKQIFKEYVEVQIPKKIAIKEKDIIRSYRLINNKVIIPSDEEVKNNNRAHSAKLRIIEKIIEGEKEYGKF